MPESKNKRKRLLGFPKSYAFLVGINNYPKINANLKSAVNDAKALAQVLKNQQGFDHVELLIEDTEDVQEEMQPLVQARLEEGLKGVEVQLSATGANFRKLLQRIQDPEQEPKINPQDCIVFYYAGHGKPGEFNEGPAGYLLPSDTRPDAAKLSNDSLLPMEDVFETLKVVDCHHTIRDFGTENISLQRQLWQAVVDNHKQQTVIHDSEDSPDRTSSFSKLWDNNTKLLQVLDQVSDAAKPYVLAHKESILNQALRFLQKKEQGDFKKIWQDFTSRGEVPRLGTLILSGYSDKLLVLYLKKGVHWLNEAEIKFVQQSWKKRIRDILDIKKQRDEALALALNSRAQALPRVKKATAMRIAQVAHNRTTKSL